ncbi:hypothetical protein [Spirosoma gilvum]
MNRKKLLDQQSHCIALAKMQVDEMTYRQELNHPESFTNAYSGPILSYLAEQGHLAWQLSQLDDQDKANQ